MVAATAPEAKSSRKVFGCSSVWGSVMPCGAAAPVQGYSYPAGAVLALLRPRRAPRVVQRDRCLQRFAPSRMLALPVPLIGYLPSAAREVCLAR